MKKIILILSVFVIVSCGKKDDPAPSINSNLIGTWTVVSTQTVMTVKGKSYEQYLIDEYGFDAQSAKDAADELEELLTLTGFFGEWEFKSDGTWTGTSDFVTQPVTGKWTLSADATALTLTNSAAPGDDQTGTITKLTDTDFWIEEKPTSLPSGTLQGFEYKAVIKSTRKK